MDRVLFLPYSSFGSIEYLTTCQNFQKFLWFSMSWVFTEVGLMEAKLFSFIYLFYIFVPSLVVGCLKEILKRYSKFTFQHVIIQAGMDMVTDIILSFFFALDAWYNMRDQIYIYIRILMRRRSHFLKCRFMLDHAN